MSKKTVFLMIGMVLLGGSVFAATTGSLTVQGTVPAVLDITVTATAAANTLDLTTDVADLAVATVVERSNKKAGYTVTLQSANGVTSSLSTGRFKSADVANGDYLDYSLKYGGSSVTFTNGIATITDSSTKTTGTGASKNLTISYTGASGVLLYEDTYLDTLTFTIIAK